MKLRFLNQLATCSILACLFTVTSCDKQMVNEVATTDQKIQNLVERWVTRTESQAEIAEALKDYKSLNADELNLFIKAKAAYKVNVLGESKAAWVMNEQAELELNKASVARYGKGFNQIKPQEDLELSDKIYGSEKYAALNQLLEASERKPQKSPNGRVASPCVIPGTDNPSIDCSVYYQVPFNSGGAFRTDVISSNAKCASFWRRKKKTGQSDCDYSMTFEYCNFPTGTDPNNKWRALVTFQPEVVAFFELVGVLGVQNGNVFGFQQDPSKQYVNKQIQVPYTRSARGGGIQNIADNVKLNPNF